MKKSIVAVITALITLSFYSCIRDLPEETPTGNQGTGIHMSDLKVPDQFTWDNLQQVDVNLELPATKSYVPSTRILLFQEEPELGGNAFASGSILPGKPFTGRFALPARIEKVWVRSEDAFGGVSIVELPIVNGTIQFQFGGTDNPGSSSAGWKSVTDGPDCNTGCDVILSGGGNVTIQEGKTYCVTDNFSGNLTFAGWNGGGTLQVCGTANINNSNLTLYENCHIIVAEGGSLTTKHLNMGNNATVTVYAMGNLQVRKLNVYSANCEITNFGTLAATDMVYCKAPFYNYGTLDFAKDVDLDKTTFVNEGTANLDEDLYIYGNSGSFSNTGQININKKFDISGTQVIVNDGTLVVNKQMYVYSHVDFTNNHIISVDNKIEIGNTSQMVNNCQITATDYIALYDNADLILNGAYLKSDDNLYLFTNHTVELNDGSMIVCTDTEMSTDVTGTGLTSTFLVYDEASLWNNSTISGPIEMVTTTGQLSYGGPSNFINGASYTSIENGTNYLPVTGCNPEGFGSPTVVDTDFDGVPDELDEYPEDPERAYNNWFPGEESWGTVAFEDLWPSVGDYDFNDVVVAFNANVVTNASNLAVDFTADFTVLAVGASMQHGFGFQLDNITPDMVESTSGMALNEGYISLSQNGLESNQPKAVVIVTDNIEKIIQRAEGLMFNTVPGNLEGTSDTVHIVMHFSNPVDPALITQNSFNPFIIKELNRSVEIHCAYYAPTAKMNTELFGTGQDASIPGAGVYYVTDANLPWGMILLEPFDYPVEKSEITEAYNYFSSWAESGGNVYSDWYSNTTGYRNTEKIYSNQ
ncbi:MAG: LruC domain-containing protein [Bacteroidales bacterium]